LSGKLRRTQTDIASLTDINNITDKSCKTALHFSPQIYTTQKPTIATSKKAPHIIESYEKRNKFYHDMLIPIIGHMLLAATFLFIVGGVLLFFGEFIQPTGIEVIDLLSGKFHVFSYLPIIVLATMIRFINKMSYKHIKHS